MATIIYGLVASDRVVLAEVMSEQASAKSLSAAPRSILAQIANSSKSMSILRDRSAIRLACRPELRVC